MVLFEPTYVVIELDRRTIFASAEHQTSFGIYSSKTLQS